MSEFLGGYTKEWYDNIIKTRPLVYRYNNTTIFEIAERYEILEKLLEKVYPDAVIEPPFRCDNGFNISLGKNFYSNYNLTILDHDKIVIGDNVQIGPNVTISSASHPLNAKERNDPETKIFGKPIHIGDNVWIGGRSVILPGVELGDNVVVGAGSVVTKSFPKNVIIGGNPAKVIKSV